MIRIRDFQEDDYAMLSHWWQRRGGVLIPRHRLPGIGRIAEKDGVPTACGFMYLDSTGSGVAWPAWIASNPDSSPMASYRGVRHIIRALERIAEALDYGCAVQTLAGRSLKSLMQAEGYIEGDTGLSHLFKNLNPTPH